MCSTNHEYGSGEPFHLNTSVRKKLLSQVVAGRIESKATTQQQEANCNRRTCRENITACHNTHSIHFPLYSIQQCCRSTTQEQEANCNRRTCRENITACHNTHCIHFPLYSIQQCCRSTTQQQEANCNGRTCRENITACTIRTAFPFPYIQ